MASLGGGGASRARSCEFGALDRRVERTRAEREEHVEEEAERGNTRHHNEHNTVAVDADACRGGAVLGRLPVIQEPGQEAREEERTEREVEDEEVIHEAEDLETEKL